MAGGPARPPALSPARVLHVADERKAERPAPYFAGLSEAERAGITAIAMDRWEPNRKTVQAPVPDADAKIVFDKFHILQHVGDAVDLWDYTSVGAARTFFRRWYGWAMRSRLEPRRKVARMLQAHRENILTYLTHRVTNAVTEGLNATIQWIKYAARGYRDREAFKMAIYFHCGGLDLEPRLS